MNGGVMNSTLTNISLNSLNVSTRIGIPQSSFNKFNKTMNQLNKTNMITFNNSQEIKKKELTHQKEQQQDESNEQNEIISSNVKEKKRKVTLSLINVQSNAIAEYKYVPPRRPRYIHCINKTILNNPHNLSKSLPIYTKNNQIICEKSNIGSQSSSYESEEPNRINFIQIGDPSDCCFKTTNCYRTPALPLRMKIKISEREAESCLTQDQLNSSDYDYQRAKTTFGCSRESNQINHYFSNDIQLNISDNEQRSNIEQESLGNKQKPKNKNVQCMGLKIFGESGDQIGCFSAKIPVRFPVTDKYKAKHSLHLSSIKTQPNIRNPSPISNHSKSLYSGF